MARASQRKTNMRATTVRFSEELWLALEDEAAHGGVSVAQYLREAALLRLTHAAALRGDPSPYGSSVPHESASDLTKRLEHARARFDELQDEVLAVEREAASM